MRIYLVDYENVGEYGIRGIGELLEGDQVHVFYSEQIKTIPFERCVEMAKSKATIDFVSTHKTAKNYLDFQLSMYLGYLVGKGTQGRFFVVSKDTGYDAIVDFGKDMGLDISRCPSIDPEEIRKGEQQKLIENQNSLRRKNNRRHRKNNGQRFNNPVETVLASETKNLSDVTAEMKPTSNIEVRSFKAHEKVPMQQTPKTETPAQIEKHEPAVQKEVKKDLVPQKETAQPKPTEKPQATQTAKVEKHEPAVQKEVKKDLVPQKETAQPKPTEKPQATQTAKVEKHEPAVQKEVKKDLVPQKETAQPKPTEKPQATQTAKVEKHEPAEKKDDAPQKETAKPKQSEKTQAVQAPKVEASAEKKPAVKKETAKQNTKKKSVAKTEEKKVSEKTADQKKDAVVEKKETSKGKQQAKKAVAKPAEKKEPAKKVADKGKKQELPEKYRQKVREAVKEQALPLRSYTILYRIMVESEDKMALNNSLVKEFSSTKGGQLYSCVKAIFMEFKKS